MSLNFACTSNAQNCHSFYSLWVSLWVFMLLHKLRSTDFGDKFKFLYLLSKSSLDKHQVGLKLTFTKNLSDKYNNIHTRTPKFDICCISWLSNFFHFCLQNETSFYCYNQSRWFCFSNFLLDRLLEFKLLLRLRWPSFLSFLLLKKSKKPDDFSVL